MENISLLFLIISLLCQTDAALWTYDGELGVESWKHNFPDGCSGQKQSPIDIRTRDSYYDPKLNDFAIWYDPPKPGSTFHVINNGHALQVNVMGPFHVTNGGLPSLYSTAQFHFHWGHANHQGSEHLINGRASPLELHVVNYDSVNYDGIGEAMVKPMGLAVLGVMYEVGEEDNPALEPIIQAMEHVKDPDDDHTKELPAQPIRDFLPDDTTQYYRYNGSLTTPMCFQSVLWTVFKDPQYISHRQLTAFRKVLQPKRHKNHRGKKHHKRHRRSAKTDEQIVEEVMDEAGIKNNLLEKLELKAQLEKNQGNGTAVDDTPKLGESPEKFYLQHEENPDMDKVEMLKEVNQSSGDKKEQTYKNVQTENEKHLKEIITELEHQIDRLTLVNNFRPVQPLNGRTVYRSFEHLTPVRQEKPISHPISTDDDDDPDNNSTRNISSWSILLISLLVFFLG